MRGGERGRGAMYGGEESTPFPAMPDTVDAVEPATSR